MSHLWLIPDWPCLWNLFRWLKSRSYSLITLFGCINDILVLVIWCSITQNGNPAGHHNCRLEIMSIAETLHTQFNGQPTWEIETHWGQCWGTAIPSVSFPYRWQRMSYQLLFKAPQHKVFWRNPLWPNTRYFEGTRYGPTQGILKEPTMAQPIIART